MALKALRRVLLATVLLVIVGMASAATPDDLSSDINDALASAKVDISGQGAIAVALGIDGAGKVSVLGRGAYGLRRFDASTEIKVDDLMLVASCGKSFTAAVFGVLVTKGLVKWSDKIGDILKKHQISTSTFQATFMGASIEQLLQHRAGFNDNTDFSTWPDDLVATINKFPTAAVQKTAIRRAFALYSFTEDPAKKRGEFLYSNIAYNIAAWLSELISGKNWENQITEYFAKPLKMKVGFGLPYDQSTLAEDTETGPVGQQCTGKGDLALPDYDWEAYSPFGVGSGGIYMRIGDLATWTAWHVRGLKGLLPKADYNIINQAAFAKLHKPFQAPDAADDGSYAAGWYNLTGPDRMEHDGSYANFRSKMIGVTQEDDSGNMLALAVSTNINDDAEGTCTDAVGAILNTLMDSLIAKYLPSVSGSRRRAVLDVSAGHDHVRRTRRALKLGTDMHS